MLQERLRAWETQMEAFRLPEWESLPELELYMDQVVLLMTRYLAFPPQTEEDEKVITASIVNNYVRMKIMPPPVKKRYSRVHLAYLLVICTLKQSLSIASIQRLMPVGLEEEEVRKLYTRFVQQYATTAAIFSHYTRQAMEACADAGCLPVSAAIMSNLSKALTEFLLLPQEGDL